MLILLICCYLLDLKDQITILLQHQIEPDVLTIRDGVVRFLVSKIYKFGIFDQSRKSYFWDLPKLRKRVTQKFNKLPTWLQSSAVLPIAFDESGELKI